MYIFHNTVINNFLLLRVLIFIAIVQQVIAAHHRIIIKDSSPTKENKHKSTYIIPKIKKPDSFEFQEDEFLPVTTTEDYYETINTNNRNKPFVDKIKRFKSRTTPRTTNFADLIEFTTQFSQKLSVPKYESSFDQYHTRLNNSLDLPAASSYNQFSSINFNKLLSSKEEFMNYRKNYSAPYEVHEEIQEDSNSTLPATLFNRTKLTNIYYNHKYT